MTNTLDRGPFPNLIDFFYTVRLKIAIICVEMSHVFIYQLPRTEQVLTVVWWLECVF